MITNLDWLRSCSLEELARFNVRPCKTTEFDYIFDGEDEVPIDRMVDGFITSDGTTFYDFQEKEALDYELCWLQQAHVADKV